MLIQPSTASKHRCDSAGVSAVGTYRRIDAYVRGARGKRRVGPTTTLEPIDRVSRGLD